MNRKKLEKVIKHFHRGARIQGYISKKWKDLQHPYSNNATKLRIHPKDKGEFKSNWHYIIDLSELGKYVEIETKSSNKLTGKITKLEKSKLFIRTKDSCIVMSYKDILRFRKLYPKEIETLEEETKESPWQTDPSLMKDGEWYRVDYRARFKKGVISCCANGNFNKPGTYSRIHTSGDKLVHEHKRLFDPKDLIRFRAMLEDEICDLYVKHPVANPSKNIKGWCNTDKEIEPWSKFESKKI